MFCVALRPLVSLLSPIRFIILQKSIAKSNKFNLKKYIYNEIFKRNSCCYILLICIIFVGL